MRTDTHVRSITSKEKQKLYKKQKNKKNKKQIGTHSLISTRVPASGSHFYPTPPIQNKHNRLSLFSSLLFLSSRSLSNGNDGGEQLRLRWWWRRKDTANGGRSRQGCSGAVSDEDVSACRRSRDRSCRLLGRRRHYFHRLASTGVCS